MEDGQFRTLRVGLLYNPNIGPIAAGSISLLPIKFHSQGAIKRNHPHDIIWRNYYQIAVTRWRIVHFGTPRIGPIYTPKNGPVDEGLISISP